MQRISFAPVLSATLSRDSCWIIGSSPGCRAGSQARGRLSLAELLSGSGRTPGGLLGLLEDLDDAPALRRGQRPGLLDADPVTHTALVLLVVRLELAGPPQHLAVEPVLDAVLDGDDDRLLHLVADHQTLPDLAVGATRRLVLRLVLGDGGLVAHVRFLAHASPSCVPCASEPSGDFRMPSSRSRTTV